VLRLRARTGFYRRHAFGALGRLRTSFEQHAELLKAFEQADAPAAYAAMIGHMRPDRGGGSITDFVANLPEGLLAP
jgi:DNA-binding GntR family transcriptional regulator